jgi:hypothetical protein
MNKLRVLARGLAMVPDLERLEAGVRRFVGRKIDPTLGYASRDENGNVVMSGGWPPSHQPGSPDEVPVRAEYVAHVKDNDLWPADEATAAACGVKFEPRFGGEYDRAELSLIDHEER